MCGLLVRLLITDPLLQRLAMYLSPALGEQPAGERKVVGDYGLA
jgi:hypothetical protein